MVVGKGCKENGCKQEAVGKGAGKVRLGKWCSEGDARKGLGHTVQVPSISNARSTISPTHFSTASLSLGLLLSYRMLSWKFPSPICPRILAKRPRSSNSFFDFSMMSGSLESGTATSVDHSSWPGLRNAIMLQSDSFLADHSFFCSCASLANSKSPLLCASAIARTILMLSCTPAVVPENLKNSVGTSFQTLTVAPARFTTLIWTSSMSSMAATGTPARMILAAAAAASRIVGKVTTATLVSCGMTASFKVISVTMPSVPSEPTKRPVKLYPAEDLRGRRRVLMTVPSARTTVRLITQSFMVPYLTAFVPLQFVPTIPPILALGPGSTGRNRPESLIWSFSCIHCTLGCTTTSMSSSCNCTIWSM